MNRTSRFRPLALATATLVLSTSLGLTAAAAATQTGRAADPTEAALAYFRTHPRDVSMLAYGVQADGTPDPDGPSISVRPDDAIPLASTIKIVLLAAYAREVAEGRIDPEERVTLGAWESLYLPLSDGGAHFGSLQLLGIDANRYGYALDPTATASLDELAHVMIAYSDNAAADFLRRRIGDPAIRSTIAEVGLAAQDPPFSILGTFLSWTNHETGVLSERRLRKLRRMSRSRLAAETVRLESAYLDPRWRRLELQFQAAHLGAGRFDLEARAAEVGFPRGSVRDYARLMAGVVAGTLLSPAANTVLRRHLELELPSHDTFLLLGQKGGSLAGVLTIASYAIPAAGELAGKPRVAVVFVHHMSERDWAAVQQTLDPVYFAFRLERDADFLRRVAAALTP